METTYTGKVVAQKKSEYRPIYYTTVQTSLGPIKVVATRRYKIDSIVKIKHVGLQSDLTWVIVKEAKNV